MDFKPTNYMEGTQSSLESASKFHNNSHHENQRIRTQLLARAIKDLMSEGVMLKWVHSGAQLADSLTEIMETSFLRETLKYGFYQLHDQDQTLKDRANARNRLKWLKTSEEN